MYDATPAPPASPTPAPRRRVPIGAILAAILLGCIALLSPLAGILFALTSLTCTTESPELICGGTAVRVARLAPPVGAGIGLLIAIIGCLPRVRRRAAWLWSGYAVAFVGIGVGCAIAFTAP